HRREPSPQEDYEHAKRDLSTRCDSGEPVFHLLSPFVTDRPASDQAAMGTSVEDSCSLTSPSARAGPRCRGGRSLRRQPCAFLASWPPNSFGCPRLAARRQPSSQTSQLA